MTIVALATEVVLMVKLAWVCPAATVTVAGTEATVGLELESETTAPPLGGGPVTYTLFPVVDPPPPVLVGYTLTEDNVTGLTVSVALWVLPPEEAVIVTEAAVVTQPVVIVKFAEVAPAATVTEAATEATAGLALARVTTAPPLGAGPLRYTLLFVVGLPPTTLVGDRLIEDRLVGLTVSVPLWVAPP